MCTLSFVPLNRNFLLAMNRDELCSRPTALPPRIVRIDGVETIYPREPGGGTWIACNEAGNLLALLNWHVDVVAECVDHPRTRGFVIPSLIAARTSTEAATRLDGLCFKDIRPFRLVGVFRARGEVCEWRWNGSTLAKIDYPWARRHWFSSSISDSRATEERLRAIESVRGTSPVLGEAGLRNLHSSHCPAPGPFSVCVHRKDASTVSYAMVRCEDGEISMGYLEGSPCLRAGYDSLFTLSVRPSRTKVARA